MCCLRLITRVHRVNLSNVNIRKSISFGKYYCSVGSWVCDNRVRSASGACKWVVMHNRPEIIRMTGISPRVMSFTKVDVKRLARHRTSVGIDLDVVVAIAYLIVIKLDNDILNFSPNIFEAKFLGQVYLADVRARIQ